MRLYYKAVGQDGKVVDGLIDARDEREVAFYLRRQHFFPIKILTHQPTSMASFLQILKRSPKSQLIFFTRQLGSMLNSGLTLMQALVILRNQIQHEGMHEIIENIIASIEDGKTFSAAIANYPEVFSEIYVALIKAAETAGVLDKVLVRLADNLEKQRKLKSSIKSALIYPIIVIITMVVVILIMMLYVIPQLSTLYDSLNISLPLPTQIVVGISTVFVRYWYFLIGGIVFFTVFSRHWYKTTAGRLTIDRSLLLLPLVGPLLAQATLVEFSRTLGFLIGTGTLVVDSLNKSSKVVGNVVYQNAIALVAKKVEKGVTIGDAMAAEKLFPPILVEMVKIGESTGKLDESLGRVSEYFEGEVEQLVKSLTTAMEPIIMIILAVGVGFLLISIITPIYNLVTSIQ